MSLEEIKRLALAERIVLVEEIWNSIVKEEEALPVSEETKAILDARLEKWKESPERLITWDEVVANARG